MPKPTPGTPLLPGHGDRRSRIPVYFFVEGETEEDYVRHLNRLTRRFQFYIGGRHTDRQELVDRAIAHLAGADENTRVWCIFDYDGDDRVDSLLGKARRNGVHVAFSNPCLELWWLLHFQAVSGRLDAITIVKKLCDLRETSAFHDLGKQKKRLTPDRWGALRARYEKAKANAEKLVDQCDCPCGPPRHGNNCVPSKRIPSTNLAELIDSMGITY
jgi:hypothetical protein